jgi:hypothetical protein
MLTGGINYVLCGTLQNAYELTSRTFIDNSVIQHKISVSNLYISLPRIKNAHI